MRDPKSIAAFARAGGIGEAGLLGIGLLAFLLAETGRTRHIVEAMQEYTGKPAVSV